MADDLLPITTCSPNHALGELPHECLGGLWIVEVFEQLDQLGYGCIGIFPGWEWSKVEPFTRRHIPVAIGYKTAIAAAKVLAGRFISSVFRGHGSLQAGEQIRASPRVAQSHVNPRFTSSERFQESS